jgi:hypothetical protein
MSAARANRSAAGKFCDSWWPVVLSFSVAYFLDWSFFQIVTVSLLGCIAWLLWRIVDEVDPPDDPADAPRAS